MKHLRAALAIGMTAVALGGLGGDRAEARSRCSAIAFTEGGRRINDTRTDATHRSQELACRDALLYCEDRLQWLRLRRQQPLPLASCRVLNAANVREGRAPAAAEPTEQAPRVRGPERRAQCNYIACDQAYRSFRAADCTFQPFEGPRRLCRK